jgi:hypothetical protein
MTDEQKQRARFEEKAKQILSKSIDPDFISIFAIKDVAEALQEAALTEKSESVMGVSEEEIDKLANEFATTPIKDELYPESINMDVAYVCAQFGRFLRTRTQVPRVVWPERKNVKNKPGEINYWIAMETPVVAYGCGFNDCLDAFAAANPALCAPRGEGDK